MKMFFSFLPAAVLAITLFPCEGRVRRQIWPAPDNPNFYWDDQGDDRDFFENGDYWPQRVDRPPRFDEPVRFDEPMGFDEPVRYDQPSRELNNFRDDFNFANDVTNGNDRNNRNNGNDRNNRNDGNDRNNRNDGRDRNQNRRTTTEASGPITSTPRTIHVAPQGCDCPMTQQFNPVCGTDGNTYRNKGLLNCYARCGSNVSQKRLGTC